MEELFTGIVAIFFFLIGIAGILCLICVIITTTYDMTVSPSITVEDIAYTKEQEIQKDYWLNKLCLVNKSWIIIGMKNSNKTWEFKHIIFKPEGVLCRHGDRNMFYSYSEIGTIGSR